MDVSGLNPIEYGGAIGHVAASQVFAILSEGAEGDWYGSGDPKRDVPADIVAMATYVSDCRAMQSVCSGERLWRWAMIECLLLDDVPPSGEFKDAPAHRRLAFEAFVETCQLSIGSIKVEKQRSAFRTYLSSKDAAPAVALEDTIFEPLGSLGEIEKHARQSLEDLATGANAPAAEDVAEPDDAGLEEGTGAVLTIGTQVDGDSAEGGDGEREVGQAETAEMDVAAAAAEAAPAADPEPAFSEDPAALDEDGASEAVEPKPKSRRRK